MSNPFANIPTIDISSFLLGNPDPDSTSPTVAAVRAAAISPGFFQITGHSISPSQTSQFFSALHHFFNLPQATKDAIAQDMQVSPRGYEPQGVQRLEQGIDDVPETKEGFVWGSEQSPTTTTTNPMARGPNRWPVEAEGCPAFRSEMMRFYDSCVLLGQALLRILALGLGLPREYFDALVEGENAMMTCRAHRYRPKPVGDAGETKGVGAHTDFGALTLLMQDDVGGLEVFNRASQTWHPVPPLVDALVVNLGDLMARWTNEKYSSTLHRVVSPVGDKPRYSVAWFLIGDPEYVVECLPPCREEGQEPKYKPITVGEHLLNRVRETYSK